MELRHKECVSVPELGFYQRTVKFLKSQGAELILYAFQELYIRIGASGNDACRRNGNIVTAESTVFPFAGTEHFCCNFAQFVSGNACIFKCGNYIRGGCGKFVYNSFALYNFKGAVCGTAFFCKACDCFLFVQAQRSIVQLTVFCGCGSFKQ